MLLHFGIVILHATALHIHVGALIHQAQAGAPPAAARPGATQTPPDAVGPLVTQFHWPGDPRPIQVQWWLPGFLRHWFSVS